jgi:hypothetical protein
MGKGVLAAAGIPFFVSERQRCSITWCDTWAAEFEGLQAAIRKNLPTGTHSDRVAGSRSTHKRADVPGVAPCFFKAMCMNREENLQAAVCKYLALAYPQVIFNSDMSGVRLHRGLQAKMKRLRSSRAMPDLMVLEPRGEVHGLLIELKAEGTRIRLRNGELTKSAHIREQYGMLKSLRARGYFATFAVGFDEAKAVIDWYMKGEPGTASPLLGKYFTDD